jgi:Flp pilus assembly protein TadG
MQHGALQQTSDVSAMFEILSKTLASRASRLFAFAAPRSFVRRQDGAAAVEFALVAAPFLALLFAIMETAIVFFAGQALETAAADSARLIMTGQAQTQGFDKAKFKTEVCKKIYGLFDCANGVYVDVKTFPDFASVNMPKPVDANGKFVDNMGYQPGGPGEIVVVRLFYQWPVYVSLLGFNLADMADGKRLLAATAAFRNEPYQ